MKCSPTIVVWLVDSAILFDQSLYFCKLAIRYGINHLTCFDFCFLISSLLPFSPYIGKRTFTSYTSMFIMNEVSGSLALCIACGSFAPPILNLCVST